MDNFEDLTPKEQLDRQLRICKYWLQIESCRQCLFEALCHLQESKWKESSE